MENRTLYCTYSSRRIPCQKLGYLKLQYAGFEVRSRVDPILPIDGWEEVYQGFFAYPAKSKHHPTRITLGTYRQMHRSLLTIAAKWRPPPIESKPAVMRKDSMHYHLPFTSESTSTGGSRA
jgi:hypothetical protein